MLQEGCLRKEVHTSHKVHNFIHVFIDDIQTSIGFNLLFRFLNDLLLSHFFAHLYAGSFNVGLRIEISVGL